MRIGTVLSAVALACGGAAQAQGGWDQRTAEATQIRQFDIVLMVAVLRCQATGVDLMADYAAFLRRYRPVFAGAADDLEGQVGPFIDAQAVPVACDVLRDAVMAAAVPPSRDAILALARRAGMAPRQVATVR